MFLLGNWRFRQAFIVCFFGLLVSKHLPAKFSTDVMLFRIAKAPILEAAGELKTDCLETRIDVHSHCWRRPVR